MEESKIYDCIVIGAGLSGLKTANLLNYQNISTLVLEAKDRVGGRTDSIKYNDYNYDVGGQWVGPTQYRINELIRELNLTTFPQYEKGKKVMDINGEVVRFKSLIPPIGFGSVLESQLILWRVDWASRGLDPKNPSDWNMAEYYDSLNFQKWMDDNIWFETTKKLIEITILAIFSSNPKDLSTLFMFIYFKSAGGIMNSVSVKDGAQQDRIYGSAHNISLILSKKLLIPSNNGNNNGDGGIGRYQNMVNGKIKLNSQVIKIEHDFNLQKQQQQVGDVSNNLIRVITKDVNTGEEIYHLCKILVITVPPNVADHIVYEPELTTSRRMLTRSMKIGKVIKFILFYQTSWWRELGFSGEIISDRKSISFCYDGSLEDGSKPCIIGFFEGDYVCNQWSTKSESERKQEAIDFIYKSFECDQRSLLPCHYIERDWTKNKWSEGGYGCIVNSNQNFYLNCKSLREPIGNIHFAGTETATQWIGYLEGALESAERVSNEIIPKFIKNYKPQTHYTNHHYTNNTNNNNISILNNLVILCPILIFCVYLIYNLFIKQIN